MTSIAETFKAEMLARLQAAPLSAYGTPPPDVDNILRSHLTNVTRDNSPAIHVRFPRARPTKDKSCYWLWVLDGTVSVYSRDDSGDVMADPLVVEVLKRLNPEIGSGYANGVTFELLDIQADTEIADLDTTRTDIKFTAKYTTRAWAMDEMA